MISSEDQAVLDALDFEPAADRLSGKQRLIRGLGALAGFGMTAVGLKYLPFNAYEQLDPRAVIDFAPAIVGIFLGYEAISGEQFFGHSQLDAETDI